jgi:hypothetical protein
LPHFVAVGRQAQRRAARVFERTDAGISERPVDLIACILALIDNLRLLHRAIAVHDHPDLSSQIRFLFRAEGWVEAGDQLLTDEVDLARRQLRPKRRLRL